MLITIILKDSWSSVEKWACHKVYYEPIWWNLHMVSRVLIVSKLRPGQVFIFTSPYWISGPFIVCVNSWLLSHDKKPCYLAAGVLLFFLMLFPHRNSSKGMAIHRSHPFVLLSVCLFSKTHNDCRPPQTLTVSCHYIFFCKAHHIMSNMGLQKEFPASSRKISRNLT